MAAELGWSAADIREARKTPLFFEAICVALTARQLAPVIDDLDVQVQPGMTAKQRLAVTKARAHRAKLLRWLRGD